MADLKTIRVDANTEVEERLRKSMKILLSEKTYDLLPRQMREINFNSPLEATIFEETCDSQDVPCYRLSDIKCRIAGSYDVLNEFLKAREEMLASKEIM